MSTASWLQGNTPADGFFHLQSSPFSIWKSQDSQTGTHSLHFHRDCGLEFFLLEGQFWFWRCLSAFLFTSYLHHSRPNIIWDSSLYTSFRDSSKPVEAVNSHSTPQAWFQTPEPCLCQPHWSVHLPLTNMVLPYLLIELPRKTELKLWCWNLASVAWDNTAVCKLYPTPKAGDPGKYSDIPRRSHPVANLAFVYHIDNKT